MRHRNTAAIEKASRPRCDSCRGSDSHLSATFPARMNMENRTPSESHERLASERLDTLTGTGEMMQQALLHKLHTLLCCSVGSPAPISCVCKTSCEMMVILWTCTCAQQHSISQMGAPAASPYDDASRHKQKMHFCNLTLHTLITSLSSCGFAGHSCCLHCCS